MPNKPSSPPSYLWYDYETWGTVPSRDRIAQFAAIRTDMDLNIIEEPINLFCRPASDTVIDPDAVCITGLSPLTLEQTGLSEWDFAKAVHSTMAQPNTCTTGYNSIRFDDECSRFLFYRNLLSPYEREWKNGNSRWDLLDVVRMTRALRPEGIAWPDHEDGSPSFKLEHLTAENGLSHAHAHDAVSDVKATIALAKLIRDKQPKLFDYAFSLRSKHRARSALDLESGKPHLHFSGRIPAKEHCLGIEIPLLVHPDRANEVIVIDIRQDPSWVMKYTADELRQWLFAKNEDLPEGVQRPPFKTIHLNRSPMIAPMSLMDDETATRLGVDRDALHLHEQWVHAQTELNRLALDIFTAPHDRKPATDPEQALYEGFISDHDQSLMNRMASEKINRDRWLDESHALQDDRLPPLILNILARHFPDDLTPEQRKNWNQERYLLLIKGDDSGRLTLPEAIAKTETLLAERVDDRALQDTLDYLKSRLEFWKDEHSVDTPPESEVASNFSDKKDSEDSADSNDYNESPNQLDLF